MKLTAVRVLCTAAAVAAVSVVAPAAPASAEAVCIRLLIDEYCPVDGVVPPSENNLDRVLVMPMIEVIGEPVYPPDPDLDPPVDTEDPDVGFVVLVDAATEEEFHSQLQRAYADWLTSSLGTGYIEGNCGYSYAALKSTTSGGYDAYHEGGFHINRPGYGYRLNIRTWDPDINTFNLNTPKTGNLNGGRLAESYTFFSVPQSDNYRAKLTRGDVYVGGNSWCYTGQPQTTEYLRQ